MQMTYHLIKSFCERMIGIRMDKLIKAIRLRAGLSQEQFAKELRTTPLSINRWENGKTMPSQMAQAELFDFCKARGMDLLDDIVADIKRNDEGLLLYHGSKDGIKGKITPSSRSSCDFGEGFYLGNDPLQPLTLVANEERPVVYAVRLDVSSLKVLHVEMGLDWAMLIAYYRGYLEEAKGSPFYVKYSSMGEGYVVIKGCIADDRMYHVMKAFFDKRITDEALFASLSALELGEQYVCKNEKACACLTMLKEKPLSELELSFLREECAARRKEAVALTEEVSLRYRRKGRYFDEIMKGE